MKNKEQLSLLAFGDMDVATRNSSFALVDTKDEAGNVTAQTYKPLSRKEAAVVYGLDVDDEKLDEKIMADSDEQIDKMIQLLNKIRADKEGFWTGGQSKLVFGKRGKSGKISKAKMVLSLVESRRPQGPSDAAYVEKLAKSYQLPGESLPDAIKRVGELIEKQKAELEQKAKEAQASTVDVPPADTTPAAPPSEAPATPPAKSEAEIMAELEAEEKKLAESAV